MNDKSEFKVTFKKRFTPSLKRKQLRRVEVQSSDDDTVQSSADLTTIPVDQENQSSLDKILAMERRRKLLLHRNRGVDAANLGRQTLSAKGNYADSSQEATAMVRQKDLEERLKGAFAGGILAGSNDMGGDEQGGILEKKHKRAMEDFIQRNLQSSMGEPVEITRDSNNNNAGVNGNVKSAADIEKELYAELLSSTGDCVSKKNKDESDVGEGDVGAGGAMMGGTGIAEVTLPIDDRIKTMKETQLAAMEHERMKRARFGHMDNDSSLNNTVGSGASAANGIPSSPIALAPVNFAPGPGKRKHKDVAELIEVNQSLTQKQPEKILDINQNVEYPLYSSALPHGNVYSVASLNRDADKLSDLGASYSHNFQLHSREWISRQKDERQAEIDAIHAQQEAEEGPEESRARIGFDMARMLAKGETLMPDSSASNIARKLRGEKLTNEWDRTQGGQNRPNDDRVWKTFMSNQRNRR